ncbi:MAG: hypothetical protein ACP5QK_00470 [Myxococcota bacterium]
MGAEEVSEYYYDEAKNVLSLKLKPAQSLNPYTKFEHRFYFMSQRGIVLNDWILQGIKSCWIIIRMMNFFLQKQLLRSLPRLH